MTDGRHDHDRFLRDVLAMTSGSPCARAESLLPDLADGALVDLDRQLVQAHVEHCAVCRALAVALGWLEPVLTQLAVVEPGPGFTDAVLARTTRRPRVAMPDALAHPGGLPGVMDRLGRWWAERIFSPAFPARVAYVATVVIVLLTSVPGAPFRSAPGRALQVITAGPASLPVIGPGLHAVTDWTDRQAGALHTGVRDRWQDAGADFEARVGRTAVARNRAAGHWERMIDNWEGGRWSEGGFEMLGAIGTSRQVWILWWQGSLQETESERKES